MSHSRQRTHASAKLFNTYLVAVATKFPKNSDKTIEACLGIKAESQEVVDLLFTDFNIIKSLSAAPQSKTRDEIILGLIKRASTPLYHSALDLAQIAAEFPSWVFSKYIQKVSKPKLAQTLSAQPDSYIKLLVDKQSHYLDHVLANIEDEKTRIKLMKKMVTLAEGKITLESLNQSTNMLMRGSNLPVNNGQLPKNNLEARQNLFLWAQPSPDLPRKKPQSQVAEYSGEIGPRPATLKI